MLAHAQGLITMTTTFRVTATGKVLRAHAGRRHLLQSKNAKRKRQLAKNEVTDKTDEARIKENLPFN